jgi:TonB family protein
MLQGVLQDVFTVDEVARAASVPRRAVQALVDAGEVRFIPGTPFLSATDAVFAGRRLRADAAQPAAFDGRGFSTLALRDGAAPTEVEGLAPIVPEPLFAVVAGGSQFARRRNGVHAFASSFIHATLLVAVLWWTSGPTQTAAPVEQPRDETRMVFLVTPGPGGGGGGGGLRNPLPPRRVERRGPQRARVTVPKVTPEKVLTTARREEPKPPTPAAIPEPKPVERAPEPLASRVLVAPVVTSASNDRDKDGVIEKGRDAGESQGAGVGGGAGTGQGTGNGQGLGSGIGDGSGGGTGGGPFRPGSGIEPPRLLREVKADYTDDARRRGITGEVVLEIVVKRDGSVGDVTLVKGLGAGLDQRAIAAVRQWRFSPARRRGEVVDVIVEVAVEFTLR